jgi:hypothetical protein
MMRLICDGYTVTATNRTVSTGSEILIEIMPSSFSGMLRIPPSRLSLPGSTAVQLFSLPNGYAVIKAFDSADRYRFTYSIIHPLSNSIREFVSFDMITVANRYLIVSEHDRTIMRYELNFEYSFHSGVVVSRYGESFLALSNDLIAYSVGAWVAICDIENGVVVRKFGADISTAIIKKMILQKDGNIVVLRACPRMPGNDLIIIYNPMQSEPVGGALINLPADAIIQTMAVFENENFAIVIYDPELEKNVLSIYRFPHKDPLRSIPISMDIPMVTPEDLLAYIHNDIVETTRFVARGFFQAGLFSRIPGLGHIVAAYAANYAPSNAVIKKAMDEEINECKYQRFVSRNMSIF